MKVKSLKNSEERNNKIQDLLSDISTNLTPQKGQELS